jgi:hypothetical protein
MIDFAIQAERNDWDDEQVAIWMNRQIDLVDVAIDIAHNVAAPQSRLRCDKTRRTHSR